MRFNTLTFIVARPNGIYNLEVLSTHRSMSAAEAKRVKLGLQSNRVYREIDSPFPVRRPKTGDLVACFREAAGTLFVAPSK